VPPDSVEIHPEAWAEATVAVAWYAERSVRAAESFVGALEQAITRIAATPERWPKHLHGTRRLVLRRFPFAVVYRTTDVRIQVVAIAHAKRRPGYWRKRSVH
jgi:plasmid stabilization system protein ParE